jgi:hypothetical protein
MKRRGFLRFLGAAAVAAAADPEQLIWQPARKLISIPPGFGRNRLMPGDWLTRETLRVLQSNVYIARQAQRAYNNVLNQQLEEFIVRTQARHDSLLIRRPRAFADYQVWTPPIATG